MSKGQKARQESESISEFRLAASRFCEAVDGHLAQSELQFLQQMSSLLPALYAAAARLHAEFPEADTSQAESLNPDQNSRWSGLMDTLEPFLARSDRYRKVLWAYPDTDQEEKFYEGCLAADLAFTYEYLKPTVSNDTEPSIPGATIKTWSEFIWLKGRDVTQAITAIHDALHDSGLFKEKGQ